jgi:hypothetical protein
MEKSVTVGELKAVLKNLPDDLPVYIQMFSEATAYKKQESDDMHYVAGVEACPESSISNEHLSIVAGKGFGW